MRKIKIEDAIGQTLCHDLTGIMGGNKGVAFQRGHVIREEDIPKLLDIGKSHIFVWEPDADEVHEEDAALAAVEAACGANIHYDKNPSEGKVLFYASVPGLFKVNRDVLRAINSVGDYTLVCLPNYTE